MKALLVAILLLLATPAWCTSSNKQTVKPAWALWNIDTGALISANGHDQVRPVASITKLMVALVVLNSDLNLDELLLVTGPENSRYIRRGMLVTRGKLLELALVSSDNLASRTLAETHPGGYHAFIDLMNGTARALKMDSTSYSDATGLLNTNRSSIEDISRLVLATQNFPVFSVVANSPSIAVEVVTRVKNNVKKLLVRGTNTNREFVGKFEILAAKTGYTSAAGRCLTMLYRQDGKNYLLVVTGAKTVDERSRLVNNLIKHAGL